MTLIGLRFLPWFGRKTIANVIHSKSLSTSVLPTSKIPLSQPVPNLPTPIYAKMTKTDTFATDITKLESGLTIATEKHVGDYCTVGVAIDAGCRYESAYPSGISHFIEKLAFGTTQNFGTKDQVFGILDANSALIDCQSTRDTFIYAASCRTTGMDDVMRIIADAVLRPVITAEELNVTRDIIRFDIDDRKNRPECEALLTDWIHLAAFRGNTLGLTRYCPSENIDIITREHLFSFLKTHFTPKRMVIAGVGVDHDVLVASATKHFDASSAIWSTDKSLVLDRVPPVDTSVAQYTGGELRIECDLSSMSNGPSPFPNLAHAVLGFQSCGYLDDDFVPFCVLQSLMGGGGSFSAGGPGKGMYTRLYMDVLNRNHWMYNATAFNQAYKDAGVFCIQASSAGPEKIGDAIKTLVDQYLNLSTPVPVDELARAKTQLKSQLMMNLEVRPVRFEDTARQVIGHGVRRKPQEYLEKIDAVNPPDIVRIGERMLASPVSLVGYGQLNALPSYELIDRAIAKRDRRLLNESPRYFKTSWRQ